MDPLFVSLCLVLLYSRPHNLCNLCNAGEEMFIRRDFKVTAFRTHHVIPDQVILYACIANVNRRKEYLGLPGVKMRDLKLSGLEITYSTVSPQVAFTGDTTSNFIFDKDNANVVIFFACLHLLNGQCFFFSLHFSRSQIVGYADRFENQAILLIHFSAQQTRAEIEAAVSALGSPLAVRVFAMTEGF
ncbi:hypothetical protein MLD38_026164 [Melastoma candidum]|uniref:Uncharacterized protein n=1 Tax=Melastoma candidum TaxID=119954 RepID=A0ACB9P182_9MYRT|nr:hypothetical protein MLD38_026164 [Melastoma candidum]